MLINYYDTKFAKYKKYISFMIGKNHMYSYLHEDTINYYDIKLIKIQITGQFAAEPIILPLDDIEMTAESFGRCLKALDADIFISKNILLSVQSSYICNYLCSNAKLQFIAAVSDKLPRVPIEVSAPLYEYLKNDVDIKASYPNFYKSFKIRQNTVIETEPTLAPTELSCCAGTLCMCFAILISPLIVPFVIVVVVFILVNEYICCVR